MKKYHIILILFWMGLSFFFMMFSYRLGLGGFNNPGAGLTPFLLGFLLLIASLYLLIRFVFKKEEMDRLGNGGQSQTNYGKLGFVLVTLFIYALLLERLGFLITTSVFLILLFRGTGNRWRSVLVATALTVLVTYSVFTLLGVRFPLGILRLGG